MSKVGLMEREEGKFFALIIADQIPVKGVGGLAIKMALPLLINGLDDKVGDKVPEPWQSLIEDVITSIYVALQDNVLSDEEVNQILEKCTSVINAEIDLPLLEEADEATAFLFLLKFIATQLKIWISGVK